MSVLNVLNTTTIAGEGSAFLLIKTGIYRAIPHQGSTTVQFDDGPVIQLDQAIKEGLLLQGGKPGRAGITRATDSATAVYTLGDGGVGLTGNTHPFAVGDYIETCAPYSGIIGIEFESAAAAGKVITATTSNTITTNIDSSAATADYVYAGGDQGHVHRCVKITAGANGVIVEEVQIVGG
jgi:sulfur relay (sulfurtransferase) DsrF/TusC family protein